MKRKKSAVKERISKTILELLGEKSITDIKISELTKRAKVARASFYRNFNSYDEVIDYIAEGYKDIVDKEYIPLLSNKDYDAWYSQVKSVLTGIYAKKDTFNDVLTNNLKIIFDRIQDMSTRDLNHEWTNDQFKKYEHIAKISAFYSVCMAWVKNGAKESIEQMTIFILDNIIVTSKSGSM